MAAPLSIVIPTLNAAPQLAGTASALMEGVEIGLVRELVISDGGSADDTAAAARAFGLPYGDQGLLMSRALYDAVGGYRDQPLMEDVEIARALRGRLAQLPVAARTSPARYEAEGWTRRGARNLSTLLRYRLGVSPARLARRYHGGD